MHILQQLRLLLLVLLHISPGKADHPIVSSNLFLSQARACTAVSAALQRALTADVTLPLPPYVPRTLATVSSWRSTNPTWSVSASLCLLRLFQITFQMTLTLISVTMGRALCSSWPAPVWGRMSGTSAAPGSRRVRPSLCAGQWLEYQYNNVRLS